MVALPMLFGCDEKAEDQKSNNQNQYEEAVNEITDEPDANTIGLQQVAHYIFYDEESASYSRITYYRDAVTDVMYVYRYSAIDRGGSGGLTWMPDPETGLPMTYTKYMELYREKLDK